MKRRIQFNLKEDWILLSVCAAFIFVFVRALMAFNSLSLIYLMVGLAMSCAMIIASLSIWWKLAWLAPCKQCGSEVRRLRFSQGKQYVYCDRCKKRYATGMRMKGHLFDDQSGSALGDDLLDK